MSITCQCAGSEFDQAFGDLDELTEFINSRAGALPKGLIFRCMVAKDIAPRHERFELTREMGCGHLEAILYKKKFRVDAHMLFMFPERNMSPWEQQRFTWCLAKHPSILEAIQKLGRVVIDVWTGSPMLVSSFYKEQIRVAQNDELRAAQVKAWGE